jgi:hypothetical protein
MIRQEILLERSNQGGRDKRKKKHAKKNPYIILVSREEIT